MDNLAFAGMALVACALALLLERVTAPGGDAPQQAVRFAPLDGLRGFCALLVFLVHAAVWRRDAQGYAGPLSPSVASAISPLVVLFFMTSAFIFVHMVVYGRRQVDWLRLGVSRVVRLVPLYMAVMVLLFAAVAAHGWVLREPVGDLLRHLGQWLSLTSFGAPDINRVANTLAIVSGATWTLPYEVLFYLTLPALALLTGRPVSWRFALLVLAVAMAYFFGCILPSADRYALKLGIPPFVVGAMVAALVRWEPWSRLARSRRGSWLAVGSLLLSLAFPLTRYPSYTLLFPSVAFALFAGGNACFGLLTCLAARRLGEVSYSVYLLHGLLLHAVLTGAIGIDRGAALSSVAYWSLIVGLTPVLLGVSHLTYNWIERPAMASGPRCTDWIRSRLAALGSRATPLIRAAGRRHDGVSRS